MSEFGKWELPKRVSVEEAKRYFCWYGIELARQVLTGWGDDQAIGAELADIREKLGALEREQGEVVLTLNDMTPCGVAYERA